MITKLNFFRSINPIRKRAFQFRMMGSFKQFFIISLIFHFFGLGISGLDLHGKNTFDKGIISVKVYDKIDSSSEHIKTKKINIRKKTDKFSKKKKFIHLAKDQSFLTKKDKTKMSFELFNDGMIPRIAEKNQKKKAFFTKEENLPPFQNSSSEHLVYLFNSKIKKKEERENTGFETLPGTKDEISRLSKGVLREDSDDKLGLIRDIIERSKRYPLLAQRKGIEGTAFIRFRLKKDGSLDKIEIEKSSGRGILDRESIDTIKRAAPLPYVNGWIVIPLDYKLSRDQ